MAVKSSPPVLLIHGLWLTPLSWEYWVERYEREGYHVLAPAWPGMEGDIEELRADPQRIERLGIEDVVDYYDDVVIKPLARAPIIIGHSFGGAFAEILLDRGLGCAGVAIDAAPVRGVRRLSYSTLRSVFPALKSPANQHRVVALSPEEFHYALANTMSRSDSDVAYDRYAAPGPGRVLWQGVLANFNRITPDQVDFHNDDRAPLLLIGGGEDHIVPATVDRQMARKESSSRAVTGYREFPGRSHLTIIEPGWEEIADYALRWALAHSAMPATV